MQGRSSVMKTLDAIVLSSIQFFNYKIADRHSSQCGGAITSMWRLRIVYGAPGTVYDVELHEPLKSICAKRYTIGMNGLSELEMLSDPGICAGTRIRINAYKLGERILGRIGTKGASRSKLNKVVKLRNTMHRSRHASKTATGKGTLCSGQMEIVGEQLSTVP